jgi:ATP-dependent DNA helicase 2 subunit 1
LQQANHKFQRAGQYVIDWGHELEAQYQKYISSHGHRSTTTSTATKRAAPADGGGTTKKIKTENVGEEEMRERFESGTVDKLTLPILKEFLAAKKMAVAGKKAELVDRVIGYFESK